MFKRWKKYLLEIVRGYKRNGHWIFFWPFQPDYETERCYQKSADPKMNSLHAAEPVRPDHGHPMTGYDTGIASGAGSPYLPAHSHHHHHHHHLSASHDTISSHSVAALQRLSNTLEPAGAGEGNPDHGSASSYHHHSRSSATPPHKLRKLQQEEDDVGSESDVGDQHSSLSDDDIRPQYLAANCVVYTFFRGDISQVIDDHFARALSQSSSDKPKGKRNYFEANPDDWNHLSHPRKRNKD